MNKATVSKTTTKKNKAPKAKPEVEQPMTELVGVERIPFYGDELIAVEKDGQGWVILKRMCECLGVDFHSQMRRIKRAEWAAGVMMTSTGADGKHYEMFCLSIEQIPYFLATLEVGRVSEAVRPKLRLYQREVVKVLADHFLRKKGTTNKAAEAPVFDVEKIVEIATRCALNVVDGLLAKYDLTSKSIVKAPTNAMVLADLRKDNAEVLVSVRKQLPLGTYEVLDLARSWGLPGVGMTAGAKSVCQLCPGIWRAMYGKNAAMRKCCHEGKPVSYTAENSDGGSYLIPANTVSLPEDFLVVLAAMLMSVRGTKVMDNYNVTEKCLADLDDYKRYIRRFPSADKTQEVQAHCMRSPYKVDFMHALEVLNKGPWGQ